MTPINAICQEVFDICVGGEGAQGIKALQYHNIKCDITDLFASIGPSEVSALPLGVAAERIFHFFRDYFSSLFLLSSGSHSRRGLS